MAGYVGERFKTGSTEWEVSKIEEYDSSLVNIIRKMKETGKEPRMFFARKILKSGKLSEKQGGMFFRFESGNFIKAL